MTTQGDAITVRLVRGSSLRQEMVFRRGTPETPVTVGRIGAWTIAGPQIADVHIILAFNGTTLFVCATPGAPAALGVEPVGPGWFEVRAGGNLTFGSARLEIAGVASHPVGPSRSDRSPSEADALELTAMTICDPSDDDATVIAPSFEAETLMRESFDFEVAEVLRKAFPETLPLHAPAMVEAARPPVRSASGPTMASPPMQTPARLPAMRLYPPATIVELQSPSLYAAKRAAATAETHAFPPLTNSIRVDNHAPAPWRQPHFTGTAFDAPRDFMHHTHIGSMTLQPYPNAQYDSGDDGADGGSPKGASLLVRAVGVLVPLAIAVVAAIGAWMRLRG